METSFILEMATHKQTGPECRKLFLLEIQGSETTTFFTKRHLTSMTSKESVFCKEWFQVLAISVVKEGQFCIIFQEMAWLSKVCCWKLESLRYKFCDEPAVNEIQPHKKRPSECCIVEILKCCIIESYMKIIWKIDVPSTPWERGWMGRCCILWVPLLFISLFLFLFTYVPPMNAWKIQST